jgi:hypothetical protein
MSFNAVEELKSLVNEIEGKVPTDLTDLFQLKVENYVKNGIIYHMHKGVSEFTLQTAAEMFLSMFMEIVKEGEQDKLAYNKFGGWLSHVYYFIIDNKAGLK